MPFGASARPAGINRDRQQSSFCRAGDVRTAGVARHTVHKSHRAAVVCPARVGLSQSRQSAEWSLTESWRLALRPRDRSSQAIIMRITHLAFLSIGCGERRSRASASLVVSARSSRRCRYEPSRQSRDLDARKSSYSAQECQVSRLSAS